MRSPKRIKRRVFQVCDNCGAWRETTAAGNQHPLSQFYADYDHRFFLEQHLACPLPPRSKKSGFGVSARYNDEPGFVPPDPAKEWQPSDCPAYRPPVKPVSKVVLPLRKKVLLGWWTSNNIGGFGDEAWEFQPSGRGSLILTPIFDVNQILAYDFEWRLSDSARLSLKLSLPPAAPIHAIFFREGTWSIKVSHDINEYGERRVLLKFLRKQQPFTLHQREPDYLENYLKRLSSPQGKAFQERYRST